MHTHAHIHEIYVRPRNENLRPFFKTVATLYDKKFKNKTNPTIDRCKMFLVFYILLFVCPVAMRCRLRFFFSKVSTPLFIHFFFLFSTFTSMIDLNEKRIKNKWIHIIPSRYGEMKVRNSRKWHCVIGEDYNANHFEMK